MNEMLAYITTNSGKGGNNALLIFIHNVFIIFIYKSKLIILISVNSFTLTKRGSYQIARLDLLARPKRNCNQN